MQDHTYVDCERNQSLAAKETKGKGFQLEAAACGNRKDKLRQLGCIKRFNAALNHEKIGRRQICFLVVNMATKIEEAIELFLAAAKDEPGVTAIYEMSGDCDDLMVGRVVSIAG